MVVGFAAYAATEAHLAHHLEDGLVRDARAVHGPQLHRDLPVADAVREPSEDLGDPAPEPRPGRPLRVRERVVVGRPREAGGPQQVGEVVLP